VSITGDLLLQMSLLSVDSLFAGLVLGPMVTSWGPRAGLAFLVGLCDGAAALLGAALPHVMPDLPDGLLYALVAGAVVLAARRSKAWLLLAPVILSVDNLASGSAADAMLALAATSAGLALAGMMLSATCLRAGVALYRKRWSAGDATGAR
jgi:hypothetical protein